MSQLSINTTQNVVINFTAASVGERILAFLTDVIIQIAYAITVFYGIFYLLNLGKLMQNWDDWSRVAVIILFFIPIVFYSILLESIFEGQTLGKRLLKIKVVKIDGYQAGFGDYLIRWLFRLIDIFSNSGILALVSIVITDKSQRLGDISAGTSVISLKNNVSINSTILQEIDEQYVPTYASVIKLSDNDVRIILENYLLAKKSYDAIKLNKIKTKIETVTGIKNQSGNDADFIKTILKDYNYYTQNM
jgi:uncharacterized RDD family membrane protein YckC